LTKARERTEQLAAHNLGKYFVFSGQGRGSRATIDKSTWNHRLSRLVRITWVLLFCLACNISRLYSQQAPPQVSYEGQQVATVYLVARPDIDVDSLRSVVLQGANQPYSKELIQKSIAALQGTGRFSKVELNVIPEQDGLRLEFILEPAYRIGIIDFPGALKAFSYTRLLQTVNYPLEEPYEKNRVEDGRKALEQFLIHNGYFLATVEPSSRVDDAQQLVNVIYNVKLGRHARFGDIEVTAPTASETVQLVTAPPETAQLEKALRSVRARLHGANLKRGQSYDPDRIARAERLLQQNLGKQNHLAGRINLVPPTYDAETNRAKLHFEVTPGPVVAIRVLGTHISGKTLHTLVPIYQENAVDEELIQEGAQNIAAYLQSKGFFDAKVTSQFSSNSSDPILTYSVERGRRHRLANVDITGNSHIAKRNLMDQVMLQKARFHFFFHDKFNDDLLKRSAKNLEAYYRNQGYEGAKVMPHVVDAEPNVSVTFQVDEGDQTLVESIDVQGNRTEPLSTLVTGGLAIEPGRPYSQTSVDQDRSRLMAAYLSLGHPNATFRSSVSRVAGDRQRVLVTYVIDEGPHVGVSRVIYTGQSHTRPALISRTAAVQPETHLSERKLLAAESDLYNLGIFDWDNVSPREPITDQKTEDVLVRVHEAKRNTIRYGLGFESTPRSGSLSTGVLILPGLPTATLPKGFTVNEKTVISPLGSIEYSRLNMFGRAETASVSALVSRLDQKGSFTYSDPLKSPNWSSLLTLSGERTTQNPLFTARIGQASFQVERSLNSAKTKRLQLRYTYERTSLTNLLIENFVPVQDQTVHLSGVSASFVEDTRDKPLDAHRGVYHSLDFSISPTAFGSSDNVIRLFGQTSHYWQIAPWMVWANNVRLGLVSSFAGSHVPFSERFFTGGADSLRGFPLNGAGPQGTALLCTSSKDPSSCTARVAVPQGGKELFIINSEGRFPIPLKSGLGGVIFYDGGNVYSSINLKSTFNDYSNTVGIGLRYATPVGPIRIDIGHNLNPVPGLKGTNIFVTLGQSF